MASEATYAAFAAMISNIYDAAYLTLRDMSVVQPLVLNPNGSGLAPRVIGAYSGGTVNVIAETDDMTAQAWAGVAGGTITPTIKGAMYFINDTLIESGDSLAARDAGVDLGNILAQKVDVDLTALFASFTGGTTGTAAGTITWANVLRAAAYLRAANVPTPYFCVLRPEAWYYLTSASSGVPTLMASQDFMNDLYGANQFFQGAYGGIGFFIDANITAGTTVPAAGMFGRDAIIYDERRAFKIETQRNASRGGGGYELNATIIYGAAVNRPLCGVQLLGTTS